MENSISSGDRSATDKIFNVLLLISLVIAAICFLVSQCDGASQYIGKWTMSKSYKFFDSRIPVKIAPYTIAKSDHTQYKKIKLRTSGETATLLTPVKVTLRATVMLGKPKLSHDVEHSYGGIYKSDETGKHLLVKFGSLSSCCCEKPHAYMETWVIRRKGSNLQIAKGNTKCRLHDKCSWTTYEPYK
jgi:hypothetical protein